MTSPQLIYPYILDAASGLVNTAYTQYTNYTSEAWSMTTRALDSLNNYYVPHLTFNARFDPQVALSQFPTIAAPTSPDFTYDMPPLPGEPPVGTFPSVALTPAPVDNTVAPVYSPPVLPTLVAVTDPGAAPVLKGVTLPAAPTLVFPDLPPMIDIGALPAPPTLNLPAFQGHRPVFDAPFPTENFSFTPTEYVDALLTKTKQTISDMQSGQYILPAAVAQALRNRATLEADAEVSRAHDEAYEQFAARGFEEPNGVLVNRLLRVDEDARTKRAGINRDVYVQDQQVALENLRFAVTQGVALEGTLIQAHQQQMQMSLEAAKYAVDMAISILNARISVFNAQMMAYQTDATVFRELIQAESAKLDLYRTQLEGEKLKIDINDGLIRLYEAQLRGVQTLVEVYKTQLEAATTEIQINAQYLDQYRTKVQVMSEQVRAQATQIEGYGARVNAETAKAKFYEVATQGYATRVQAWGTGENVRVEAAKLQLANTQSAQEVWRSKLALFTAQMQSEQARIETIVKKYGADADIFKSKASVASSAAEANNRMFALNLSQEQAVVDTELKRAELDLKQLDFIAAQTVEIKKAIAQVGTSLTSAAMSAVNFHAGTSYSGNMGIGYNLGVNFSGPVDDGSDI